MRSFRSCHRGSLRLAALVFGSTSLGPPLKAWADARGDEIGWIESRTGIPERLDTLALPDAIRAVRALSRSSDPRALDHLIELTEPREEASPHDERFRWELSRALARHAHHETARLALAALMATASGGGASLDEMTTTSCALAIASANAPDGTVLLARALSESRGVARAAHEALVAFPPSDLVPLHRELPELGVIETIEAIGDQRSFLPLRNVIRTASAEARARAAIALLRLGALEVGELASHWWRTSRHEAERAAAATILVTIGDYLASDVLDELLRSPRHEQRLLGLELSRMVSPEPRRQLIALVENQQIPSDERRQAMALLGRDASPDAVTALFRRLNDMGLAAALALVASPSTKVDARLVDLIGRGTPVEKAWALRVVATRISQAPTSSYDVRTRVVQAAAETLADTSKPKRSKNDDLLRGAAAWALAILAPERAVPLLRSQDSIVFRAVARQTRSGPLAREARRLLAATTTPIARQALLTNAVLDRPLPLDPTRRLLGPLRVPEPLLASLATYVAPTSLDPEKSAALSALPRKLGADSTLTVDPVLEQIDRESRRLTQSHRSALAFAWARSPRTSAVPLLIDWVETDADPVTRRAATLALLRIGTERSQRTLAEVARLDPDSSVRALAHRRGFPGPLLPNGEAGDVALIVVDPTLDQVPLRSAFGETLVLAPDVDGFCGVVGAGPLAPLPSQGEAARESWR